MSKQKATQSSIIRLLEDVEGDEQIVPKGTVGVIVETYTYPREGYSADMHIADGIDENITLYPDQFEVLEEHNIDIGGKPPALNTSESQHDLKSTG